MVDNTGAAVSPGAAAVSPGAAVSSVSVTS